MSYEDWKKENEAQGIVAEPTGFEAWKQESESLGIKPVTGNYAQQFGGALAKGGMSLARAGLKVPGHLGKTLSMLEPGSEDDYFKQQEKDIAAEEIKMAADSKYKPPLWYKLSTGGKKTGKALSRLSKEHEQGVAAIIKSHPEWEVEPPENFVDLLTSPRKLTLAIAESTPLLLAAGVTASAGAPQVALGMMYATEGQGMADQVIADGGTDEQAEAAYHLYGSVASILENLQLGHFMKGSKGLFGAVLGRVSQKLARKSITKEIVKIAAQEALEEMSQGTWQEATAKMVYGKDPEGGLLGFVDRRAQEGLIGFTMGLGAGGGGVAAGAVAGKVAKAEAAKLEAEEPVRKKEERELLEGTPYGEAYVKGFVVDLIRIAGAAGALTDVRAKAKLKGKKKRELMQKLTHHHARIISSYEKISDVIDKNPVALSELAAIKAMLPAFTGAIESFKKKPTKELSNKIQEFSDKLGELRADYSDKLGQLERDAKAAKAAKEAAKVEPQAVEGDNKRLVAHINKKDWWRTAEPSKKAIKDRGQFYASSFKDAEFYGRPLDTPFKVGIENPLVGDESTIMAKLGLELPSQDISVEERFAVDKSMKITAEKLGYDSIVLMTQAGYKKYIETGRIPRSIELNKLTDTQSQPETPDQAIGKQYGLEPTETQTRLDDAELRYQKLNNTAKRKRSNLENKELAFLRRNRTNIGAILERETAPLENKMPKKKVMKLGHDIPVLLGMTEVERLDFNRKITGQISMKDMTPAQRQQVVTALGKLAKERGINVAAELKVSPLGELVAKLEERKQKPELTNRDRRDMRKLRKILHTMQSGTSFYFLHSSRLKRVCHALDNYEDNGPFTKYIYQPVKSGDTAACVSFNKVVDTAIETMKDAGINAPKMMVEVKDIGVKSKLTTSERIGVYALAQNENTMNHLLSEFTEDEIAKVVKSVEKSEDEMYVAESIKAYFELGWPMFQKIAAASGVASDIVKEKNYITAFVTDRSGLDQPDFMEGLTRQFAGAKKVPGQEHTKERKRGARRNIELDIFAIHARAARSIERFKVMAPIAKKVGGILNNKKFKQAANDATYGHGSQVFDRWLQDSIRGSRAYDPSLISANLRWMRAAGIGYVLGFKVLTAAKQGLSFFAAAAVDPGMIPLLAANMTVNTKPGNFKKMEALVESKSDLVKTRDWNRDLRTAWDVKAVRRKYAGKKLSPIAMRMCTAVDHYTVVTVWMSAYQLCQKHNMNEQESVEFADGVIEKTQPMGKAVDLPNFFRGNELEVNLTTFQNMVNQNGNILWYDILGERKAKKISNSMMGYRLLMSQIAPALLLGMISRGRPPEDLKEAAKDVFFYMVSPFTFFGTWIYNIVTGSYGPSNMIVTTGLVETGRLGSAIRQGDPEKIIKGTARTAGAWSGGKIPLQAINTAEGAWRLANDETEDFRELVWSQYAIKSKNKKKKKTERFTY